MQLNFDPKKNISKIDYPFICVNKINDLLIVSKIVKNWYDVLLFRLGIKKKLTMKLRSGKVKHFNNQKEYFDFWNTVEAQEELLSAYKAKDLIKIKKNYVEFKYNGHIVKMSYKNERQLVDALLLIREQFVEEQYKLLNVKDKIVVDIGANIGDSAIYFALKGAKHVYAFEPYPFAYQTALENIKLNNLEDKVTIINAACGGKSGKIGIDENYESVDGSDLKSFSKGKLIDMLTLEDIIKHYNISYNSVLKIDCEGCEYGILLNASKETLSLFDQIVLEYHYGYKNLVKKLKELFKVKITAPRYSLNNEAENTEMLIGLLICNRK
ncbi:MAG: hexuronic acid methyltransferase AglP [Candidatus Micrarchaeota archaeon]|nr:MAG: hexuronic acid methyltransferase AglP [Candidatus Micrarchaeota archaeon]